MRYTFVASLRSLALPLLVSCVAFLPGVGVADIVATKAIVRGGTITLTAVGVSGPVATGSNLLLEATATGTRSVVSVRFTEGAATLAVDNSAPWQYLVTGVSKGTHKYKVQVSTQDGARYNSAVLTIVARDLPNQPPTAAILTPANNAQVTQGLPVDLTADARDPDGSIARVEYWRGTTLLGSATTTPYKVTLASLAVGNYSVVAKAFDNAGASATSTPVNFTVIAPPTASGPNDGARLLLQATFGPSLADIQRVGQLGVNGWLDEQFAKPLTYSHLQYLRDIQQITGMDAEEQHAYEAIWQNFLFGSDQLRARVAFALSEIIVISNIAPDQNTWALASWMDMLYRNAFGNYRTLLEEATLHPAMGYYLNVLGNDREDPIAGYHPNENYARELQQLFSIGLVKLNAQGVPVRDAQGKTTPTYDQSVVEGFAQVFTGWNFAGNNTADDDEFYWPPVENWIDPMAVWPTRHSPGTKKLLDGVVLPGGQTPQQDLTAALDVLFNHPNVGPFVSRRLIQFFVTSNPTPDYVGRVAAKFNDNGNRVRGDLRAVMRAILTDTEARDATLATAPTYGKVREPVIRFTHLLRATGAKAANGRNSIWWLDSPEDGLGQSPLLAPSVFNFFSPFFARPGAIAQAGLVSPELQIHTETQVVGSGNLFSWVLWDRGFGFADTGRLAMDWSPWVAIAGGATAFVDQLSLVFTGNGLSATTRATLIKAINAVPATDRNERVRVALTLLMVAPDFVVQH